MSRALTAISCARYPHAANSPTRCEHLQHHLAISLRLIHRRARGGRLVNVLEHRYAVRAATPSLSEHAQFPPAPERTGVTAAVDGVPRRRTPAALVSARFRVAHLALLGQGLAIGVVGGFALAWSKANLHFGLEGIPVLGLTVTPLHGGLLMACGALAILACLGRWTTVVFSVLATVGWLMLTVVCAVEAAHHAPGLLGFDPRDTLLYGVLGTYNFVVCVLLAPTLRRDRLGLWARPQGSGV
jgi:hypothetical protein